MDAVVFEVGGRMWLLLLWSSWMHIGIGRHLLVVEGQKNKIKNKYIFMHIKYTFYFTSHIFVTKYNFSTSSIKVYFGSNTSQPVCFEVQSFTKIIIDDLSFS